MTNSTHSDAQFERHGWRGIGVPVDIATRRDHLRNGFVAVSNDPQSGEPAVSLWWPQTGPQREAAFWMSPDGARQLALSLLALAMKAEAG